jgi:hypothetical protein
LIQGFLDEQPPVFKITYTTTPILNRTFTLYIDISDDVSGLDIFNINIEFNGTQLSASFTPNTLTVDLDKVTVTVKLTMRASLQTTTLLTVSLRDNSGKTAIKKYIVVFYTPGTTPSEKPVYEIVEETTTPSAITTATTTSTSYTFSPTTYTTSTATSTIGIQITTTLTTLPTTSMGGFNYLTIGLVIIVVVLLIITVFLLRSRRR